MKKVVISLAIILLFVVSSVFAQTAYPLRPYKHNVLIQEGVFNSPGRFDVSLNTGSAIYSYQIKVPDGTNDLQPNLELFYSSQGRNKAGLLGSGWDLTESYIEKEIDSGYGNVTYVLILNGQQQDLVYSSGKYHTKKESFLSIENLSASNDYNESWSVKTKDGTEYKFGLTSNSEQNSSLVLNATRWYLEEIEDTYGNNIYYNYSENPYSSDAGAIYLKDIQYNNDRSRKIEFIYESSIRPDNRHYYGNDHKMQKTRRLKEINITSDNKLIRKYVFEFNNTISHSLTFLESITELGNDGVSNISSTEFFYNGETKNWVAGPLSIPLQFRKYDGGTRAVDLNRDGLIDFVRTYQSSGGHVQLPILMKINLILILEDLGF